MKKATTFILVILILCLNFESCNKLDAKSANMSLSDSVNMNIESNENSGESNIRNVGDDDIDLNDSINVNQNLNGDVTDEMYGTSIEEKDDSEYDKHDGEFPFDNIIVERNGYDIVAAGRYYGSDFDDVKYYGSYYRIIDNYADFSDLTQWGNKINESVFEENFILVLHTYQNCYLYNSTKSQKGTFSKLKIDENSKKLSLLESWTVHGMAEIGEDEVIILKTKKGNEIIFPADVKETMYLVIPKSELPKGLSNNGEIDLKSVVYTLE